MLHTAAAATSGPRRRRDRAESCGRCHSDLNSHLLLHCAGCGFHQHTYCCDPPRIANDPIKWHCAACAPSIAPSPPKPTKAKTDSFLFAKKRALPLPKPKQVAREHAPVHPLRRQTWLSPSTLPPPTSPRPLSPIPRPPFDWETFCAQKAAALETTPPPRHHRKLERIVWAWIDWRRKQPRRASPNPRQHRHQTTVEGRPPREHPIMVEVGDGVTLPDWRAKYKDESDASDVPRVIVLNPVPSTATHRLMPPPKPPMFTPPEVIQVDSYSIDMSDMPPSVDDDHATKAAKAIQGQIHDAAAQKEAIKRRQRQQHHQLLLEETATDEPTRRVRATKKLQRWWRRWLHDRTRRQHMHAAATIINLRIRRYLAKKHHRATAAVNAQYMLQAQRAQEAKRQLQLERARTQARARLDRFLSGVVVPHINRRFRAIVKVQAQWRRYLCQSRYRAGQTGRAVLIIQCAWRQALARRCVLRKRELWALGILQKYIRGWFIRRVVHVERKRMAMVRPYVCIFLDIYHFVVRQVEAVEALHVLDAVDATATSSALLHALGLYFYGVGDWWNAASCLERACRNGHRRDVSSTVALAYSHHMTWHRSYDTSNLTRAYDLYTTVLKDVQGDPHVLHDIAVLMFERAEYKAGLDVMAHVLSLFPQFEHVQLSILWVAVVLQHIQRGDESVQYLSYLLDQPPPPFTTTDMTILCALGYHCCHQNDSCKQGLAAAAAQWKPSDSKTSSSSSKASMLFDLGTRATKAGHYLLAYSVFYYGLHRAKRSTAETWLRFADTLRHLGRVGESKQALEAAQTLEPTNSVVQTALMASTTASKQAFEDELNGTKDLEFVHAMRRRRLARPHIQPPPLTPSAPVDAVQTDMVLQDV
ncbi:Aste57867_9255 [Aphanomyces stellatus]|uniref:Aste57867_9255 protein n=1 Tax=Aphanomyces stellatus TaxID=120398 RepID=A0A485KMQ7_9STRA|nr:hypothetical protein As57867_009219 [Aphanomyces stellatus]VFT86138.1 Aste57867_9255 [Aphanomyces stellatus]